MSDVLERAVSAGVDVVQLAHELIKRPSLTPEDAGCQAVIIEQLRPFNFAIEQIDFNDVRNLWARRGEAAPLLIFVGHTDVVPSGPTSDWDSMPFSPTLRNGCLYGRGAADMKGGIAAFIAALSQFLSEHPSHAGVARLVGIEGGVVSGVFNLESSDVGASDRRPRHDDHYHEA